MGKGMNEWSYKAQVDTIPYDIYQQWIGSQIKNISY